MTDKHRVIDALVTLLEESLTVAIESANNAHLDATHEQSKAETQYDSLGIEMAYLAEGQSKRIESIKNDIQRLTNLTLPVHHDVVQVGHLVKLSDIKLEQKAKWVFILPVAGGHQITIDKVQIQTVTPNTPMAQLLLNKEHNECVNLAWLNGEFEISIVC